MFTALNGHQQRHPPSSLPATPLPLSFHQSIEGRVLLDLVQEYLAFHHLHQTLSILRTETQPPSPSLSCPSTPTSTTPSPDRSALLRSLHLAPSTSSPPTHSVLHSLYLASQTSRPSSPLLLSPRSEDHPLPLSHPAHSPLARLGHEDLTPPISPAPSPPRRPSLPHPSGEDEDRRRLSEVDRELQRLKVREQGKRGRGRAQMGGDDRGEGGEGGEGYEGDEEVVDGVEWAKRFDYVEAAERVDVGDGV